MGDEEAQEMRRDLETNSSPYCKSQTTTLGGSFPISEFLFPHLF